MEMILSVCKFLTTCKWISCLLCWGAASCESMRPLSQRSVVQSHYRVNFKAQASQNQDKFQDKM